MSEQEICDCVDAILSDPANGNERKRLATVIGNNPEFASIASKHCLEEFNSRLEKAYDDESKTIICYGSCLISVICFAQLKKASLTTIDDIFDYVDTKGLIICVEFCKQDKSLKYFRLLKSMLTTLHAYGNSGMYCRSMEHIFEFHQPIMNLFEEMGCIRNESSSDEDLQNEIQLCFNAYMQSLPLIFTDNSFENVDENFIFKYILMCKGLFTDCFTNETCHSVFLHLFTGIPSAVHYIQQYVESKRAKQTETRMDMLKDVVVGICDTLQTKKAMVRKGITLLSSIVQVYVNNIEQQKEMILKSLSHSITRLLLMPRRSELVQETMETCIQLLLIVPFEENVIDNVLVVKPSSPDYLNAASKTYLLSYLINKDQKYYKLTETVIKQIRYCESVLMHDVEDSMSLYHQVMKNILQVVMKNKNTHLFVDVQLLLWKELFDVSNNDIMRDFCTDTIAILFNNNVGSQQFYLEYIKEIIIVLSNNVFLAPKELRISSTFQNYESIEWMIIEKILRPLLSKMDIKDYKSITNFNDILSDEAIAQLALLPACIRVNELKKLVSQLIGKLKDKSAEDPQTLAITILLKNVLQYGKMKADQAKKILFLIFNSRMHTTISDKYIEEALLCIRTLVNSSELSTDLPFLTETLNHMRLFCWARSDRVKICVCSVVESFLKNTLSANFVTSLQEFFELALSCDCEAVQVMVLRMLITILVSSPEFKDTLLGCLRPDFSQHLDQLLNDAQSEGKVKGFSKLTENHMIELQNSKYDSSMNKKKSIVAYQSDVQKSKTNIKSIQTVSVVDQLAEVNKSLNDLLTSKDKDATLLQQINQHIQDLNNISNRLFHK